MTTVPGVLEQGLVELVESVESAPAREIPAAPSPAARPSVGQTPQGTGLVADEGINQGSAAQIAEGQA